MLEIITHTIGERITYCRSSLSLTRKELCDLWNNVSIPTLARWELDTIEIPFKKLSALVIFFNEKGLIVTEQWIKEGHGPPPFLLRDDKFDEPDFDSLAQEKLLGINQQMKNFVFGQVRNNLMSPFVKYGDYIGGVSLLNDFEIDALVGELVFLKKKLIGITVGILRKFENEIMIGNADKNSESLQKEQLEGIGKIQWIIRRP